MPVLKFNPPSVGGIESIPVEDAIARVRAYCTSPTSGWHTYDRPARVAREHGVFDDVSPWSFLWAEMLNGQPRAQDVVGFDRQVRDRIAQGVSTFRGRRLRELDDLDVEALVNLCAEGFKGFWAPKMTKVLALYLPDTVPVLDGNVARAMGFRRDAFRQRSRGGDGVMRAREVSISQAIIALRAALRENEATLKEMREVIVRDVPDLAEASEVRLLDIILWTSQEDRVNSSRWVDLAPKPYAPADLTSVQIAPIGA